MNALVIRLTSFGDVVLAQALSQALHEQRKVDAVDLVTAAAYAPLMSTGDTGFRKVIAYDRHGTDSGWIGMKGVVKRLPEARYDLIVDLQGSVRSGLLARRVSAKERRTLRKRSLLGALRALVGDDPPLETHAIDLYLSAAGLRTPSSEPRGSGEKKGLSDRPRIGLLVGTRHPTKQWGVDSFAALADRLAERFGAEFLLVGGPGDRALLDWIESRAELARFVPDDTTALDLVGLRRMLADLHLLIGVDSGPTHLGAALGVPVVALFGPTSSARWGPRGPMHRILQADLDCAPCSNFGAAPCSLATGGRPPYPCMRRLEVHEVERLVVQALESRL